jgi:hypothetical protein
MTLAANVDRVEDVLMNLLLTHVQTRPEATHPSFLLASNPPRYGPPPPASFQTTIFHKLLRADACLETAETRSFHHRLTAVRLQGKRSMGGGAGESVPGVRAPFRRLTDFHFTTNISNSSLYPLLRHSSDDPTHLKTCSWGERAALIPNIRPTYAVFAPPPCGIHSCATSLTNPPTSERALGDRHRPCRRHSRWRWGEGMDPGRHQGMGWQG